MKRSTLAALIAAALAFGLPARAQNGGGDPGVGGGAKDSHEETPGEKKKIDDKRAGNFVEFDARNMQPTGPGPGADALKNIEEMKKRAEKEPEGAAEEDKSAFFDPGKLSIEGRLDSRAIDVWGRAGFPNGTRLGLYVLQKGMRLQVMGSAFVEEGAYKQKLESAGRLAVGEYTIEAEFLKEQQPLEVREALEALDPPNRVVAQAKIGTDDPTAVLTEELELKLLFWRVLEALTRSGEKYFAAHDAILARQEPWYRDDRFAVADYAREVDAIRREIDAAYQVVKKEGEGYLVLPMPRTWDLFRSATNALLDTTVCGAEEIYVTAGVDGVNLPPVPAEISLYYVPRPRDPKKDMKKEAEWETRKFYDAAVAELIELRTRLGLHSLREFEQQFLGWAVVAVESAASRIEALEKAGEKADEIDPQEWIRVTSEWRQLVRLRQNRFERLVTGLGEILGPDYISTWTQEFETAKKVLQDVDSLYLSYTRALFEKKKLDVPGEAASAPTAEDAKAAIQRSLVPVKMAAGR